MQDKNKLKVVHSDGTINVFKPRLIKEQLLRETDISEDEADKIKRRVTEKIKGLEIDEISTSTIRAEVSAQLTSRGLFEEEQESRKLGMSVKEFEDLTDNGCKDNANIDYCLSKDNNVLIKDSDNNISIVKISEVPSLISKKDYFVPSINMETNIISWKKIIAGKKTGHKKVYLLKFGKGHSVEVTDNHNLLRVTNDVNGYRIAKKRQKISLKECIDENNFRHIAKINSIPNFDNNDNYYESALFGFFLGDGTIANEQGLVRFGLKKEDKISYLIGLCEKLNIKYTKNLWKNGVTGINISNFYPKLSKSSLIKKYNNFNSLGLLEGLINSDGSIILHKGTNLYLSYTSINKDIIDIMYVCLLMNDVCPNIYKNDKYYRLSAKSKNLDRLLSKITLRKSFQEKYNLSEFTIKRDYDELSEAVIKDYIYQGEKDVYNLTIEDNHNYLAGIDGLIPVSNSPEMVAKYSYDSIAKEYALLKMPKECADAHIEGYLHHHDLEYAVNRPNCFNADLRFYAKNGLKIDGKGLMGSVAKPAKTLEVLLNHMLQAWMAGATVFSGGQGYVNFNTLLAPFARGRTYEEIKQAIQGFIFNCNMSLICRGGQVLFSSIGIDLSIPDVLKNEPAIGPNGIANGVYQDYQEEADLIFRAICEVLNEKDGNRAYHRFPNCYTSDTPITIRKNGCIKITTIGNFVESCINKKYDNYFDSKISSETDGYEILSWNILNNYPEWKPIITAIQNPNQEIYEVTTKKGLKMCVTKQHPFINVSGGKIRNLNKGKPLDKFNKYDRLVKLNTSVLPYNENKIGTFIGFFLGDGSVDKNSKNSRILFTLYKKEKVDYLINLLEEVGFNYILREDIDLENNKTKYHITLIDTKQDSKQCSEVIHDCVLMKNSFILDKYNNDNYYLGLFSGLVNSDGSIQASKTIDKPSIILKFSNTNIELINLFINIGNLYGLNISKKIKQVPKKDTHCLCYDLFTGGINTITLLSNITLHKIHKDKFLSLDTTYVPQNFYNSSSIKSIQKIDYNGFTYDLEVADNHNYFAGEGNVLSHNCLFNIREGDLDEYSGNCKLLHELGANNPTIYYVNCIGLERTVMGALTSDTPVMTDKGFRYPQSLDIGDNVMTYTKDGKKEWKPIKNIILKTPPSKVFKITLDNNYQFKITENHKLPTNNGIIKSEDLKIGMELYDYIDEPFYPTTNLFAEFIGVFLADGYIRDNTRAQKNSKAVEFHIKQEWKKDEIISLCNLIGYEYDIFEKENSYSIYVRNEELRNYLNHLYDRNGVKHFPEEFWKDKNTLANIIKGLMFDGRKGSKYRWDWSCSDLPLVIDVMYALSYIGRTTTLYVDNRNGDTGNWRTNYRVSFGLNYKPKNKTKIKSIEIVDNKDFVYDLEIEDNHNYVCGLGGIHSENCRTALPMNYTGQYEKDCINTGNFMYSTLNLPLIAIESKDKQDFYNKLGDMCEIVYKTLHWRRNIVEDVIYNKHMSDFLLQEDKDTGKALYNFDTTTMTIGFCGLYECLHILEVDEKEGISIVNYLNSMKEQFNERDGLRWSVIASPAESASHRFATIIKEKYPDAPIQGTKEHYYLTNSSHIPVSNETTIIDHIRNAGIYHPLTLGGNILHIWLGEVWSDPEALWKLNQKIIKEGAIFWAYSKVFTFCNECGFTINDSIEKCPICESEDLITYDRITGYYLPTNGFNNGKQQEFKDRYRHRLD